MMRVRFETKTCGRCGGSGRHSYNQMHGDVCYGCGGTGKAWTKRGHAARVAFLAKRLEVCGKSVIELEPGERFLSDISNKWVTVVSVERNPEGSRWLDSTTGEYVPYTMVTTKHGARGFCHATDRVIVSNPARWADLIEFAKTLPGAEVYDASVQEVA